MCFTKKCFTKSKADAYAMSPLIAKRDIPVWKSLVLWADKYTSPYFNMRYYKGYCHYITNKKPFSMRVAKGLFHRNTFYIMIDRGLHSYVKKPPSLEEPYVKMYIPKGALYYKNKTEYVSSQLIWY